MAGSSQGLTSIGKLFVFLLVVGSVAGGIYLVVKQPGAGGEGTPSSTATAPAGAGTGPAAADGAPPDGAPAAALAETRTAVPALSPPQPYEMKDGTVAVELSEYAGYSGLIVANGGLDPSPDSIFARRHGFRVKLTLSEEESWSALNAGRLAAAATTADVLAVYGRQFKVVVPAQIGFSRGADGVVVRSELKRINALQGKVLVTSQFTEADFFIRYLAQEAGIAVRALPDLDTSPEAKSINLVYAEDAFSAGDIFRAELQAGGTRLTGCVTWAPKTTEVAAGSAGRAHVLTTNRNLLIVADVLVVNRGFAEAHPEVVAGLVDGLLAGNRMVRDAPDAHLDTIARAFGWDRTKAREELGRVHLANLPENLAFFSGAIDSAGSFGGIYQSAVLAYGRDFIKDPPDSERFVDLTALRALEKSGAYRDQRVEIAPIRSSATAPLEGDPLLTRDIRFFFEPNSAQLDAQNAANLENLPAIKKLLQVSPGSTILLRGHVDNALVQQFREKGGEAFVRQMGLKATELSKNRAGEIQRLLVEKFGVDRARIETVGRGWEEPASANPEENRRVEVQWFTVE